MISAKSYLKLSMSKFYLLAMLESKTFFNLLKIFFKSLLNVTYLKLRFIVILIYPFKRFRKLFAIGSGFPNYKCFKFSQRGIYIREYSFNRILLTFTLDSRFCFKLTGVIIFIL